MPYALRHPLLMSTITCRRIYIICFSLLDSPHLFVSLVGTSLRRTVPHARVGESFVNTPRLSLERAPLPWELPSCSLSSLSLLVLTTLRNHVRLALPRLSFTRPPAPAPAPAPNTCTRKEFSCDVCELKIESARYHCNDCDDYDVCTRCFKKGFKVGKKKLPPCGIEGTCTLAPYPEREIAAPYCRSPGSTLSRRGSN